MSPAAARAVSGTTAGRGPRTCCRGHERPKTNASSSGRSARSSAAGRSTPPPQRRGNTMARYRAAIETPRERDDVFAYISDFSTTQEWDPGVVEAERLNDAPVRE